MAKLIRRTTINAPVDKVFNFIDEAQHLPEVWPSLIQVSNVRRLPNGGKEYHWVSKMAGMQIEGDTREVEHVPNRRLVDKDERGLDRTITWSFDDRGKATEVTFEADYKVPTSLLSKLTEDVIAELNENEADTLLANLRTRLER